MYKKIHEKHSDYFCTEDAKRLGYGVDLPNKLAIYIHWPFCLKKCPYCDFNSHVTKEIDHKKWQEAYLIELDYFLERLPKRQLISIFFGGGTPSLAESSMIESIINKITSSNNLVVAENIEITLEANPTSIEINKFKAFKVAGVNRISIGIQSFNDHDLKVLGREHSSKEAIEALDIARRVFDNYSFDLIYARHNQDLREWKKELQFALQFIKYHVSLYILTIEKGTKFFSLHKEGKIIIPREDASLKFYDTTNEIIDKFGLMRYEVSNYAKEGFTSKHNLAYWNVIDYLGIGPGAHGRIFYSGNNIRHQTMNIHNPERWMHSVFNNCNGLQTNTVLSKKEQIMEIIMMGLRIVDGIDTVDIKNRLGIDLLAEISKDKLSTLCDNKLIDIIDDKIKPTSSGMNLVNQIVGFLG